jgi:hypothetical protein
MVSMVASSVVDSAFDPQSGLFLLHQALFLLLQALFLLHQALFLLHQALFLLHQGSKKKAWWSKS